MFKIIKKIIKKLFVNSDRENIELIRKSKYFDENYYLSENPEVKGDPCSHYYYYGWKEGKSPSFAFSNDFYLKNYKDVGDGGVNPLLHYLKFGKAENRLIEKDNGLTLKKVYEKVYGCAYFYKTYVCDINVQRVNLLFDSIDENVLQLKNLIDYVVNFCKKENYELRIVYFTADFELLKEMLMDNEIYLPENTTFLNLKNSNYLEIGLNEKYVCTSWKTARALLNTASIHANIYYYLPDNLDELDQEEYYQISNICTNDHVVVMAQDKKMIDSIKKCQLMFEVGNQKLELSKKNQLYCDFDKMFIVGVELLNDIFLAGVFDSETWRVNILESEKDFKFHFDTNVNIRKTTMIGEDASFIFCMSYDKRNISYDKPFINAWVEEKNIKLKNYCLISEKNNFNKLLSDEDFSISVIDNYYDEFNRCISKLKDKR